MFRKIIDIAGRECRLMYANTIYLFCMVLLPVFVVVFFTTLLGEGQPVNLPIGVVDLDHTATTRTLVHNLDGFQSTQVKAHYATVSEARTAMQRGEIYAFLYIPEGTTDGLMSSTQPKVSFYYNAVVMLAGSTTMKDLKTICTLGSAAVGKTKLEMLGKTEDEIMTFLQPIKVDLHMLNNPWANYNVYLSASIIPGILMLFIFLITPYSIGTELKFGRSKEWMQMAGNNPFIAISGKMLPQTLIHLLVFYGFEFYIYHVLQFPHPGGVVPIMLLGLLAVLSAQAFGIFCFGLLPSLRMSMSVCSLWAVLSISLAGATYPVFAMDPFIQGVAWLFPLRHYYQCYQACIFNGFGMHYVWMNWVCLLCFMFLPLFVLRNIRKAMLEYEYIP